MAGAPEVVEITAFSTPLVVAALCTFAYRRGIGGHYLVFWAAAHAALAIAFAAATRAEPAPVLDGLPAAWSIALAALMFCNLAILLGVLEIESTTLGPSRGLALAAVLAVALLAAGHVEPRLVATVVLPGTALVALSAGLLLLVRRRSWTYVIAGAVLVARSINNALFSASVLQTGTAELPDHVIPLSSFLNFLTGLSLLLIAVDDAWRRLDAALTEAREAKALSEAVVNAAPISILQKDRSLRIVKANPYAERLALWLSPQLDDIVGRTTKEVTPGTGSRKGEELDHVLLDDPSRGPMEYEVTYPLSDGGSVTLLVRKVALVDASGVAFGTISVSADISALKRSREQLRDMYERAEEASRVKTDFLANMSHELRTPLNGISGFAEMLANGYFGALNARQIDYVQNILASSRTMLGLVSDILDLSRMTTGQLELQVGPLDLTEVLDAIAAAARPLARQHEVTLSLDTPKIAVDADRRAMLQALSNLVDNAIRFNRAGGSVRVSATRHASKAIVVIADTGIGMTADQIAATGDPFLRSDPLKARPGGGSGLGLAISRGLIEQHGGTLVIESQLGEGTIVTIAL